MIQESMQLHGAMTLFISRANGDTETVDQDNLIVNVGFDFIRFTPSQIVQRL